MSGEVPERPSRVAMPPILLRGTCRCGHPLEVRSTKPSERLRCPNCGARVRLRRRDTNAHQTMSDADDGYRRFYCPCGRRLKVRQDATIQRAQCPDCRRVVDVPQPGSTTPHGPDALAFDPETQTADFDSNDLLELEGWMQQFHDDSTTPTPETLPGEPGTQPARPRPSELGLRTCPTCNAVLHLAAEQCRVCGTATPRTR